MSVLFFSLRGVPDDEADDIRSLLTENQIDFYETSAGNWGISLPALWLIDKENLPTAQRLFDAYQNQRQIEQRTLYKQRKANGQQPGMITHILRAVLYLPLLIGVLYVSVKWLFELGL